MRLRTRFWTSAAISLGTVLLVAGTVGWSLLDSVRSKARESLARQLQQQVLERVLVTDEFLLRREHRPGEQLERKGARIDELLRRASSELPDPEERATIARMQAELRRGTALTGELATLLASPATGEGAPPGLVDLEGRLRTEILRLAQELYAQASQLADSASDRARANETRTLVLVAVLVAMVLAVTGVNALQANRLIEQRVERLRRGAEQVAAGDLQHRIAISGSDELAELGRTFDGMTVQLQATYANLERSNRELEAFSYSVSHDLRAPLRHVTGFVGLLEAHAPEALDPKSRHYLDVIAQAATRMGELIDDLLEFSRMGRVEMKRDRVPLGPLVDEVVRELAPEALGREVTWEIGELPEVTGDRSMLRQVFRNLVGNALKFSKARTPARISIGTGPARAGEVEVHVRDNGVGFDMKYAPNLFHVFQRLHSAEEFEGTGVGLANVQRIVLRHGGRVRAEGSPDAGATFWVSLPSKEGDS